MRKYQKIITIITFFVLLVMPIITLKSNAAVQHSVLNGQTFYLKNAFTGQYLTVSNINAQAGTSIYQYEYTGQDNQKWYISHLGNGEYMLFTYAGSTIENNTRYLNLALDIDNGIDANGTTIHVWDAVASGLTQTFSFTKTDNSTYIIHTKCSNFSKVVSLADNLCDNGIRIHQWEYSDHSHDQWILEPVNEIKSMGISYARANYNSNLDAFPDFQSPYYDCTNFVSQCLLAGGQLHQYNPSNWYLKRLNTTYHQVTNNTQLDYSWLVSAPKSPWISADEFKDTFYNNRKITTCTGAQTITQSENLWNQNIYTGDVVQVADNNLGFVGDATHTMYITGYDVKDVDGVSRNTYTLTYHSNSTKDKLLMDFVTSGSGNPYLEKIIIFYDFTI